MGQNELPSVRGQSRKASRRMSCVQSAPHDSGSGVLGQERQAVYRLYHQAARKGWGQGRLPCQKVVCPCCVGFPIMPVLRHSILLSLQPGVDGYNLTNCGRRCVGKSQKPALRTFNLQSLLLRLYAVGDSGVHQRLLEQKFYSDVQFGCAAQKLMHYSGAHRFTTTVCRMNKGPSEWDRLNLDPFSPSYRRASQWEG